MIKQALWLWSVLLSVHHYFCKIKWNGIQNGGCFQLDDFKNYLGF